MDNNTVLLTLRDGAGKVWVAAALMSDARLVNGSDTTPLLELQRPVDVLEIKAIEADAAE